MENLKNWMRRKHNFVKYGRTPVVLNVDGIQAQSGLMEGIKCEKEGSVHCGVEEVVYRLPSVTLEIVFLYAKV